MAQCKTCHAVVIYLKNTNTGKTSPIDLDPVPDGNCEIIGEKYRVLAKDGLLEARANGVQLHMNHFATCKFAKHHKAKT